MAVRQALRGHSCFGARFVDPSPPLVLQVRPLQSSCVGTLLRNPIPAQRCACSVACLTLREAARYSTAHKANAFASFSLCLSVHASLGSFFCCVGWSLCPSLQFSSLGSISQAWLMGEFAESLSGGSAGGQALTPRVVEPSAPGKRGERPRVCRLHLTHLDSAPAGASDAAQ